MNLPIRYRQREDTPNKRYNLWYSGYVLVGSTVLYVTDGKTVTPKVGEKLKGRAKKEGGNQVLLYSYLKNTNSVNKKPSIVLCIEVWVCIDGIEEAVNRKPDARFQISLSGKEVKEKAVSYLENLFGKRGHIGPSNEVYIIPNRRRASKSNIHTDNICRSCNVLLTNKSIE